MPINALKQATNIDIIISSIYDNNGDRDRVLNTSAPVCGTDVPYAMSFGIRFRLR